MDIRINRNPLSGFFGLFRRIFTFQRPTRGIQINREALKRALKGRMMGVLLILCSLGLGAWAYQSARVYSLLDWQKSEGPSPAMLSLVLQAKGYSKVKDEKAHYRVLRSLPMTLDSQNSIWITADEACVAAFDRAGTEAGVMIFSMHARPQPKLFGTEAWVPIGNGWIGFGSLIKKLEARQAAPAPPARKKIFRETPDPRSIQY